MLVIFDGEQGSAARETIDPAYKANRTEETPLPVRSLRAYSISRGPHSKHRRAVSGLESLSETERKVAAFVSLRVSQIRS